MIIDDKIKERIAKIKELATRGVDGEKEAANLALERILKKYNVNPAEVDHITKKRYSFKYSSKLDFELFCQLLHYFFRGEEFDLERHTYGTREISGRFNYLDYVTISCTYEYFKRHMRKEWDKFAKASIKRKRKAKTKNQIREDLQGIFFSQYIMRSRIVHEDQIHERDLSEISQTEMDHMGKIADIEGGSYHIQVEKETLKLTE
ncbi:hypothetical protein [uncultured Chryseobacterium sp.]|uniref:hypothetical protein n=1 Tax=uncultured Chryseobacterium sp. TaxID=259322 RepID=UPI0025D25D6F|nr:hypothetical protein [uncultured Chryseobacterium sp.]